jgi:tetratricopeptide (TPR) repeat protein
MAVAPACAQDEATPDQRFRQGKQLIEANCGDCIGSTAVGLEAGIAEVLKALEQRYPDRLTAYKLLARAYGTLGHVFDPPDSDTRRVSLDTQRKFAEKSVELAPSDIEALQIYADSLDDPKQQIEQYRRILALKPDDPDARFSVGSLLLAQGQTAEAVAEIRRAFEAASGDRAETYGQRLNSSSFAAVGSFSNMRFTEEHQHGSEVQLWREGARLSGLFFHAEGLMGDAPAGLLEDVRWDPKTGTVSFTSKLTTGQHFCKVHKDVPSRDVFSFRGELSDSSLSGVLKRSDALHPETPPIEEKVALARTSSAEASWSLYGSRSDWEAAAKKILMFRGPRW